jgi:hypothetical protein
VSEVTIEAAREAVEGAARALDQAVEFGRLPASDVPIRVGPSVPLSRELISFWAEATPVQVSVPFGPDQLDLLPPEAVANGHAGYLGESWHAEWVLVGSIAGDPVIADVGRSGTPIMLAIHGTGSWRPATVAPSPQAFLAAVGAWLRVLYRFDGERIDEDRDFEVKPGFDDALSEELRGLLADEFVDALITYIDT